MSLKSAASLSSSSLTAGCWVGTAPDDSNGGGGGGGPEEEEEEEEKQERQQQQDSRARLDHGHARPACCINAMEFEKEERRREEEEEVFCFSGTKRKD